MALGSIPRTVFLLGAASFFNDFSSEMIYPMLPLFLSSVLGAGVLQLGLIEGIAESTAAFLKIVSGVWTDRVKRRHPFIFAGYGLAGLSRSLIGLAGSWPLVLGLRFFDRLGKGVRTSPRDALIADVTPEEHRGKAYGLQRAMDHAGAVAGPVVAAVLMSWGGLSVRHVFLSAALPAAVVMLMLILANRHAKTLSSPAPRAASSKTHRLSWRTLTPDFKRFLAAVFVFELGGSTDAFLLLRLADVGVAPAHVALLWSALHIVKMSATYGLGVAADRVSRGRLLAGGWLLYTVVYGALGLTGDKTVTVWLFLLYGLYCGLTEPAERALISQWAPPQTRGTFFGYYYGTVGLAALPAGLLFGFYWKTWGPASAFYMSAGLSAVATLLLTGAFYVRPPPQ